VLPDRLLAEDVEAERLRSVLGQRQAGTDPRRNQVEEGKALSLT
jgi:hypothetical protein